MKKFLFLLCGFVATQFLWSQNEMSTTALPTPVYQIGSGGPGGDFIFHYELNENSHIYFECSVDLGR